jgi:hypothetical protein
MALFRQQPGKHSMRQNIEGQENALESNLDGLNLMEEGQQRNKLTL